MRAAKFLHLLHIYRIADLPYQTQIVPLAAILADLGDAWGARHAPRQTPVLVVLEWGFWGALWLCG